MRVLERKPLPERFNEWITADEDRENNGDDPIYADVHDGALWCACEEWLRLTGRSKRATDDGNSVDEDEKAIPNHCTSRYNSTETLTKRTANDRQLKPQHSTLLF